MIFSRVIVGLMLFVLALIPSVHSYADEETSPLVGLSKDLIYFVMPDRYRNGDSSNDSLPGYDPTNTAFFHGGDLKGLTGNCEDDEGLARIKSLGFTSVWMTPLVVQQPPTEGGAGYHGYWGVDFLNVDPHLGTNEDLSALSKCAKKLGLKLILDVVTNHTGDIIWYKDRQPYIPEKFKDLKNPAWLNDISNYHNVGDMNKCWSEGSCTRDGDFYGLDDLATEKEAVYLGWAEVYGSWISRYGIEGFRVDTAKHVDNDFFKNWSPRINERARNAGINNFTIFGEVWEQSPIELMNYIRINKLQTALDFPFQRVAIEYAASSSDASTLRNLFDYDDYYTDKESSAHNLVTFLGNHDMGRAAFLIETKKVNPPRELLARVKLAHSLLYLSRGIPVVYYGDEVGMTGTGSGNDQLARQDMFATKVAIWKKEKRVGSKPVGESDSFNLGTNELTEHIRALAKVRARYPALANGQMQIRYARGSVFAFSKRANVSDQEFVIVMNNSPKRQSVRVPTATSSPWSKVLGSGSWTSSGADLNVDIPGFQTLILKANKSITETNVQIGSLKFKEDSLSGFHEIKVQINSRDLASTEFFVQQGDNWKSLGVDQNSPFTYYINPEEYSGNLIIKAKVTNSRGKVYEVKPRTLTIAAS